MTEFFKALYDFLKSFFSSPVAAPEPDPEPPAEVVPIAAEPDKDRLEIAIDITSKFEGKGYDQITGDFDKQGISAGILQWNIGQGSLVSKILKPYIAKHGSITGFPKSINELVHMTTTSALSFVRTHMLSGTKVKVEWEFSWENFLSKPEVIALQLAACSDVAASTDSMMKSLGLSSVRAFAFCFDVVTQNGSLKGLTLPTADMNACDRELASFPLTETGKTDFNKNRLLWRAQLPTATPEQVQLLRLSMARAKKANITYWLDVLNRKGSIAMGQGSVHGLFCAYPQLGDVAKPVVVLPLPSGDVLSLLIKTNPHINPKAIARALPFVQHEKIRNKDRILLNDFDQPDYTKRSHLLDLRTHQSTPFLVGHGAKSDMNKDQIAEKFSNASGSNCTPLGAHLIGASYVSSKFKFARFMYGLEDHLNGNSFERAIRAHSSLYITDARAASRTVGDSLGCLAFDEKVCPLLFPLLDGILAYNYHSSLE